MKFGMKPLVSIIIPCYNAEKYISIAVDSVLNQTYKDIEILLFDDGSTDSTVNIIQNYLNDKRIRVLSHYRNQGIITTLNECIEKSTGEFIARMDADDISFPLRIETLVRFMMENPQIDIVGSGCDFIDRNGKVIQYISPKGTTSKSLKFISLFSTPVIHGSILGKHSVFKNNKYEKQFLHSEDYRLFSKLALHGYLLANIDMKLYQHRIYNESISKKYEDIQIITHLEISKQNLITYFDIYPGDEVQSIIANRFTSKFSPKSIIKAFQCLNEYYYLFNEREECSEEDQIEIENFLTEQKIDILIQALKRAKSVKKIEILGLIILYLNVFLNKNGIKFLGNKFKAKISSLLF